MWTANNTPSDSCNLYTISHAKPLINPRRKRESEHVKTACLFLLLMIFVALSTVVQAESYGPYSAKILAGGPGIEKPLDSGTVLTDADASWTMFIWFQSNGPKAAATLIAGMGCPLDLDSRFLGLSHGHPFLRLGKGNQLVATVKLNDSGWHLLAATMSKGSASLYLDGNEAASHLMLQGRISPYIGIAPADLPAEEDIAHFNGSIQHFEVLSHTVSAEEVANRFKQRSDSSMVVTETDSHSWPLQYKQQMGLSTPQDESLMPYSRELLPKGVAQPLPPEQPTLTPTGVGKWQIAANWKLAAAGDVNASPAQLSQGRIDSSKWLHATVPGTVLTTLINRGVYPDSDFGLNNLAIPESLNKQDYWYRVEFSTPSSATLHHFQLTFNGINYAAEVWLNGSRIGDIKGAFLRGSFDVTPQLRDKGENVLAVRVSPPPHPGIAQEQSIKGGPGPNGGIECIDGPTFVATEGWDWIPSIRDRNTGIWQDVVLSVTDNLRIGDPQIISRLPLPDTSTADIEITVPVSNSASTTIVATISASFEGMELSKQVNIAPGSTSVLLSPKEFPQLHLNHPRLWWPNGYGKPDLYHLILAVAYNGSISDHKETTFGVREVTYELTLFDREGQLHHVEVLPTEAHYLGINPVDVSHQGMRQTAHGWAATMTPAAEQTAAIKALANPQGLSDLILKVNGVRIAARGGSWGMDDSRKRVSREHLEPFFRLHRDANLNIIRNWVGQNSEESFFQLADEYGMMVWNDFWASTQDYNAEPQDTELFLRNAHDTVSRFRNHPSIVIWCGRNEGVPQPILNEGLIHIFQQLDGTRYYTPNSRDVNLRGSGPYSYEDPTYYYNKKQNRGFSVELGIQSFPTLESFQHTIAPADQWPISDAWAYHDWHQSDGGDTHLFMQKMEEEFGAADSLKDFERKAQMFNYVDHRAIFEGFNQHLWTPNSGRLLWMTQSAWPSTSWQIIDSDSDTSASYYGVKKACEPIHIQMDLTNSEVALVNTTQTESGPLQISARIYSLGNQLLSTQNQTIKARANAVSALFRLNTQELFFGSDVLLVRLEARDAKGQLVSDNFYWLAAKDSNYRSLTSLKPATISAVAVKQGNSIRVHLRNNGTVVALELKLTAKNTKTGERILPTYLSDNYVSLLPGEDRTINMQSTNELDGQPVTFGIRGWNLEEFDVAVSR
jgi:beta-galactosidase/beta-glucuronidase